MYFSPAEFLVLICGFYPACCQHSYVVLLYCDAFYKALQSRWQVWVQRHPSTFFFISPNRPGHAHQPSLHGNTAALQGVVTYGQCCYWPDTCQVRAGSWLPEICHLQRQGSQRPPWNKRGRKEKGFQFAVQARWQTKAWEWTLYHTDKSWEKKATRWAVLLLTPNIRLEDRKILVGFWDLKTVRT